MRQRFLLSVLVLFAVSAPSSAATLNYFEWTAVAKQVLTGRSVGDNGRYHEFVIDQVLRGDIEPGSTVRVDLKQANRSRNRTTDRKALHPEVGVPYILLLEAAFTQPRKGGTVYWLSRGVRGVRELPAEGAEALLVSLRRFVAMQDQKSDVLLWRDFERLLEETDPMLVETALQQFIKFRRGGLDMMPSVLPLLDHPFEQIRAQSARLAHQLMVRHLDEELPEQNSLRGQVVALARRDPSVEVRVSATEALDGFRDEGALLILEEIAANDPEQAVRYAAEKILLDRKRATGNTVETGAD